MRTCALLVLAAAALLVPASAVAKGASEAEIEGPGLDAPIVIDRKGGEPEMGGEIGQLARDTGFFPAAFGQQPSPMLPGRPEGDLGERYTISWVMPDYDGQSSVRQDLYPYAPGGPVTYMKPGQKIFPGHTTVGGWFRGQEVLKDRLVEEGLPANPPGGSAGDDGFWGSLDVVAVVLAAALAAIGGASLLLLRRRPRPSAAA